MTSNKTKSVEIHRIHTQDRQTLEPTIFSKFFQNISLTNPTLDIHELDMKPFLYV